MLHLITHYNMNHPLNPNSATTPSPQSLYILLSEGIYLLNNHKILNFIEKNPYLYNIIFALEPDVAARGLRNAIPPFIKKIDYPELVTLIEQHKELQSW